MTLYRYIFKQDGIYKALEKHTDRETFEQLLDTPAFTWLPSPPVYKNRGLQLEAWFTAKGVEMFRKLTQPVIERYVTGSFILVPKVSHGLPGAPVYIDEYQVIINKGSCDWCQGGAADALYGQEGISADIDDGVLRVYDRGREIALRHIYFCPICGRTLESSQSRDVPNVRPRTIDAIALTEQVVRSMMDDGKHKEGPLRVNHRNEHRHFLNLIDQMPTIRRSE